MLISMSTRGPFPVRVPSGQDYFAFARADRVAGHRRCGNHRTKRVDGRERPRIVSDWCGHAWLSEVAMHEHELYRRIPKMEETRDSDYVIQY